MIRQTSIQAYYAADAEFRFGKQTTKIYNFLKDKYPSGFTRNEISRNLGITINATCGRIKELLNAEWVEEIGKRLDQYSSKENYIVRFKIRKRA